MFTFIDLFAGIGGFHQAAKELGWQCVFASEIDKHACKTYQANHGMVPHGDITKIDAKDIPDHDILFAGFPCQSFSVAGKRLGFEDTRGTLFFEIARILKEKQPKMFLLENVKGLKSHDKGKTLAIIVDTLQSLGYNVHYTILNTKDYGVPQNRERIFFVGFKEARSFQWPQKHAPITLSQFFGGNWAKETAHTIRKGGRGSRVNDKHNWDSYIYSDLRNGNNTIHSWDIIDTTDREKEICMVLLKNRRKKIYGDKDGNSLSFNDLVQLIPDLQHSELEQLIEKKILKKTDDRYDFHNAKNSCGINGIHRVFSSQSIFPTITATKQLDFVVDDKHYFSEKAIQRLNKWEHDKTTSVKKVYHETNHIPTLRATYYKDNLKIAIGGIRRLTPRECAQLQGFPDNFIFPVSDSQAYKQCGNAVSVNVVREILKNIRIK